MSYYFYRFLFITILAAHAYIRPSAHRVILLSEFNEKAPFFTAVKNGNLKEFKELLSEQLLKHKQHALTLAIAHGHISIINELKDIKITQKQLRYSLDQAVENKHNIVVRYYLPQQRDEDYIKNAIQIAAQAGNLAIIMFIFEDLKYSNYIFGFEEAVSSGYIDSVRYFLPYVASIDKNKLLDQAIAAASKGYCKIYRLLLTAFNIDPIETKIHNLSLFFLIQLNEENVEAETGKILPQSDHIKMIIYLLQQGASWPVDAPSWEMYFERFSQDRANSSREIQRYFKNLGNVVHLFDDSNFKLYLADYKAFLVSACFIDGDDELKVKVAQWAILLRHREVIDMLVSNNIFSMKQLYREFSREVVYETNQSDGNYDESYYDYDESYRPDYD